MRIPWAPALPPILRSNSRLNGIRHVAITPSLFSTLTQRLLTFQLFHPVRWAVLLSNGNPATASTTFLSRAHYKQRGFLRRYTTFAHE